MGACMDGWIDKSMDDGWMHELMWTCVDNHSLGSVARGHAGRELKSL